MAEAALEMATANMNGLAENPYPGRGIALGLSEDGEMALQAYWVMGRSENSRNRILVEEVDVVRTEAYDESKVVDPSLIIYNAMRIFKKPDSLAAHVVSNGDQTDTVIEGFENGASFAASLETREYEPDEPNYTPRISGLIVPYRRPGTDGLAEYGLSVISKAADSDEPVHKYYRGALADIGNGSGLCVHTYLGDGSPLPPFDKAPFAVPMGEDIYQTAETFWQSLNADNRVAIAVKGIHLASGESDYLIINAHEE